MTSDGPGQEAGDVYIGLDLGTSGLKAVALAESGAILARASAAYPTHRPAAGAYEQDPGDWLRAVEQAIAGLGRAIPVHRWRAIGLSGMLPTLVTLGPDGQPTGPAVTWQDGRADDLGDEFRERCGPAGLYRLTGQWVDGRYLLPMFGRIARDEPSRAAVTATIASAKDYLFAWLTGELATDPSTAAGYGCYELESGRWNAAARAQAGLPGDGPPLPAVGPMLPGDGSALLADGPTVPGQRPALPVVRPSATSRPLRPGPAALLGCARIPVVLGAADSVLGALGLGVHEPGQVAYIAGTSTVILGIADRLILDPDHRFLVTPLAVPGCWGLEMDLLATGSAITWLAGLLGGLDAAGVIELAAGTDPGRAPVLLPYLTPGEQGALWDPLLRGAIAGLDLGHGREHLARALVNAIVLESRRCLAVLDETCGPGHAVEVAGGSAAAPSFRADLADAARRPVSMPRDDDTDHSARGAALVAALATDGG
ncbi:MAG TPA: FGGY family carbohydrate kinase, partial [Streptosporangiaceae bacterium]|nr:FGGY family carbohydrate kinase [Streptosporangiaceae bacterium]